MTKYLGISLGLHLALLVGANFSWTVESTPQSVDVDFIERPVVKPAPRSAQPTGGQGSGSGTKHQAPESEYERGIKGLEFEQKHPLEAPGFIYSTYFDRVREQLKPLWVPCIRRCNTGRGEVFRTYIRLIIDRGGILVGWVLLRPSGELCVDECARSAAEGLKEYPIPNPPKGLIEGDGRGRMNWLFHVY